MTFISLLAGIGGKCRGFESAGLRPLYHVEIDPRIAEIGQANSLGKTIVGDVCVQNWNALEAPDVLAASPVCKNFSVAKKGAKESPNDLDVAEAVAGALRTWRPKIFFLENVWLYRHSRSFARILDALTREGYNFAYWHLNAADYGIPQTRKRLILLAFRDFDGQLYPPPKTHAELPQMAIFGDELQPWNGWFDAVAELVDCIPTTEIAAQLSAQERAFGDYSPGRFGWVLENVRALETPVAYRGAQGLFNVDASLLTEAAPEA